MEIKVSAPGKIILHGEHAVVYGKSAIAASLNLRSEITLTSTENSSVEVEFPAVQLKCSWDTKQLSQLATSCTDITNPGPVDEAVVQKLTSVCEVEESNSPKLQACVTFLYMYTSICCSEKCLPSMKLCVTSQLPVAAGLGSSASFSTGLAAALLLQQGIVKACIMSGDCRWSEEDLKLINTWAYQGERIIHGTPSGIDNSVATYGGALKFQAGQITKLNKIPNLRILLTSTGVPRSTKTLVTKVKERHSQLPDVLDPIMDSVEAISEKCQQCFVSMTTEITGAGSDQFSTLEDLIDINQHLLQALGVSHPTLDRICHVTSKYGLHSKLTGAGGGGCAVTLLRPDTEHKVIDSVKQQLSDEGFQCYETDIGASGVLANVTGV